MVARWSVSVSRRVTDGSQIGRQGIVRQIVASRVLCDEVATQWGGTVTRGVTRCRGEKSKIVRTRSQLREPQRTQESRVKGSVEAQSQFAVRSRSLQSQFASHR